ncbi:hypothetical protein HNQ65_005080 [Prosthecobacter vanneervenii]|uniref:NlpC/P60 domain-containing protein n=1 Tax=Prosthecobacter vanneervenii TaxID=48466 RepID=A0A7W7YG37_9BACT|nr:hypothetical protein [Prosthecobacter vanneervenii]
MPIDCNGQTDELYQFHSLEAARALQWAQYYESLAGSGHDGSRCLLLAQQWRAYEDNQRHLAAYFYGQMQPAWGGHVSSSGAGAPQLGLAGGITSGPYGNYPGHIVVSRPPVVLQDGMAFGLTSLPATVHRMLEAGNQLQRKPYIFGGGHRVLEDYGYDCSSAVSYVLIKAGLLNQVLNSRTLAAYGEPGEGRLVTLWVKPGSHTFMTICGLRLDTSGDGTDRGPRWRTTNRNFAGFAARHPRGL